MKKLGLGLVRAIGAALYKVFVAVLAVAFIGGGIAALANYSVTQGSGTTFGSVVVAGAHYAQMFLCDLTTPAQCAAVSAGGAVKVDGSAVTQPASLASVPTHSVNVNDGAGNALTSSAAGATRPLDITVRDISGNAGSLLTLGPAAAANAAPIVGPAPSSSALIGITPVVGGSAISSLVLKAGAGNLYGIYAECSSACWLMVFNSTTAPSNGSTTAGVASGNMVECIPIAAGQVGSISYAAGGPPAVYSAGITATISSTTCATLTLSTVGFIHGMVM